MSDSAKGPSATKADQNPKGGLSAAGHRKFGTQRGVKDYNTASRKDKGRWVSWALRFTGTPKPLKDTKGNPTRYALMFAAWGQPVPTSREAVQAVHAKAVLRSAQLKNADNANFDLGPQLELLRCGDCPRVFADESSLWTHVETLHINEETPMTDSSKKGTLPAFLTKGKVTSGSSGGESIKNAADLKSAVKTFTFAKNKASTKAHMIRRAKALGLTNLLPKEWNVTSDKASAGTQLYECPEDACGRSFHHEDALFEHAEAVHTFDDIRRLLSEAIRETYGRSGNYSVTPSVPSIWTYIQDLADDWVVFTVEGDKSEKLYKATYSISSDNTVTLGSGSEVVKRTVYDAVGGSSNGADDN